MSKRNKIIFLRMIIQSKDDVEDFRAFCHCVDEKGNEWELRGQGSTAGQAADDAWNCFKDTENWELHGYITKRGDYV